MSVIVPITSAPKYNTDHWFGSRYPLHWGVGGYLTNYFDLRTAQVVISPLLQAPVSTAYGVVPDMLAFSSTVTNNEVPMIPPQIGFFLAFGIMGAFTGSWKQMVNLFIGGAYDAGFYIRNRSTTPPRQLQTSFRLSDTSTTGDILEVDLDGLWMIAAWIGGHEPTTGNTRTYSRSTAEETSLVGIPAYIDLTTSGFDSFVIARTAYTEPHKLLGAMFTQGLPTLDEVKALWGEGITPLIQPTGLSTKTYFFGPAIESAAGPTSRRRRRLVDLLGQPIGIPARL